MRFLKRNEISEKINDKEVLIACITVQMGKWNPLTIVEGSIIKSCHTCNVDIQVSPSSQNLMSEQNATLICLSCLEKRSDKGNIEFVGIVNE